MTTLRPRGYFLIAGAGVLVLAVFTGAYLVSFGTSRPTKSAQDLVMHDAVTAMPTDGIQWSPPGAARDVQSTYGGDSAYAVFWDAPNAHVVHVAVRYGSPGSAAQRYSDHIRRWREENLASTNITVDFSASADSTFLSCAFPDPSRCQGWTFLARYGQYLEIITYSGNPQLASDQFVDIVIDLDASFAEALSAPSSSAESYGRSDAERKTSGVRAADRSQTK
jgi:hypothetical protein